MSLRTSSRNTILLAGSEIESCMHAITAVTELKVCKYKITLSAHYCIAVLLQGKYLSLYYDLEIYKNYNTSLKNKSSKQGQYHVM